MEESYEEQIGRKITHAVITVPANYPNVAKERTLQAARTAGFDHARLLDEPSAAAIAYGLDKEKEGNLLVFGCACWNG